MTKREERALEGVEPTLRRFILHPETFDQKVYEKHVENRLAHEGLEDERTMLSLDHPEGITPTIRRAQKPASYYERRIRRAILLLPPKMRYLSRVLWGIYYHGRFIKATLRALGMSRSSYERARNELFVFFVLSGNWKRI